MTGRARACIAGLVLLLGMPAASAHCDSLDGPVVRDARLALERRDVTSVLKWVGEDDEGAIREAFRQTTSVRGASAEARALADRYFFETLVRVHRAGEGEAFSGLKPAGSAEGGIAAADAALAAGDGAALAKRLGAQVREGVERRYAKSAALRKDADASPSTGREYVKAYVEYIHFVESVERLAAQGPPHLHVAPHANPGE
jgi:hypothetical protein